MEKKAKLTIYILIIAIFTVALVKYVIPGESFQNIIRDITNNATENTNYESVIDKMYEAIDKQDSDMYLSIIPFDYFTSNGYNTRDVSALKDFFSDKFMPKYNIDPNYRLYTDEVITDFKYTIDLLEEYDGDSLKILAKSLEADGYYPLKANTLKDAVLISVKEYCVNGKGEIVAEGSNNGKELLSVKLGGSWYIYPGIQVGLNGRPTIYRASNLLY